MSEVSAPTAAPAPSAPAGGGEAVTGGPQGGRIPVDAPKPTQARDNGGRFLTKEGSAGVVPQGAPNPEQQPGETKAEAAYRFKRELTVYGKKEVVDLDEDGIARELQKKRALEKKVGEFQQYGEKARKLLELAESDPDAFYKALGKDPEAIARQRLARAAQLGAMSLEERELHELREYRQRVETEAQTRAEQEKKAKLDAETQRLTEESQARFLKALQVSGMPQTYESLFHLIETAKIGLEDGIEYSDAELVQETQRRLDSLTDRYLGSLSGAELAKRLGPERVKSILEAEVQRFRASQGFGAQRQPEPTPEPVTQEILSPSEVNERIRKMRLGQL